jgi:hypothetical protein
MGDQPLEVYIQDHLAGAYAAMELLGLLRDQHAGRPLGQFADSLLAEVESDRATLEGLARRVGDGSSPLKETMAWLGAKLSRLKLGRTTGGQLGALEILETVGLGILGKRALWRALKDVAQNGGPFVDVDLDRLIARAEDQYERVEGQRLEAARDALRAS